MIQSVCEQYLKKTTFNQTHYWSQFHHSNAAGACTDFCTVHTCVKFLQFPTPLLPPSTTNIALHFTTLVQLLFYTIITIKSFLLYLLELDVLCMC
jgi:hypothetical protein